MLRVLVMAIIWALASPVAFIKVSERTKVRTVNNFLLHTIKAYKDYSFIFPFIDVLNPKPSDFQYTLSFNNIEDPATTKLQIFKVTDKDEVLKLQQDHMNKSLFQDIQDKALDCKDYFSDCETSFLKSQIYKQPINGAYQEQEYLIYFFTQKSYTTANFDHAFEMEVAYSIITYEKFFNCIYVVLIVMILINVFTIFKHL
jgi:hypothetical protein